MSQENILLTQIRIFSWCTFIFLENLNPLSPTSDLDKISPYNIGTISSRQVIRINKNIN